MPRVLAKYDSNVIIRRYNENVNPLSQNNLDFSAKNEYEQIYLNYYNNSEFAQCEINYNTLGVPVDKITFLSNP